MPQVVVTDAKGLYQQSGSGIIFPKMAKAYVEFERVQVAMTFAAADAADVSYGGKYFTLEGPSGKYQLYFSSIGGSAQDAPDTLPGHTLVAIANITASESASDVGDEVVTAIGSGAAAGLAEFTAVNNSGVVNIMAVLPGASVGDSGATLGSLDSTHVTTFTVGATGAGESTPTINLRVGAINILKNQENGAGTTALNIDGSGAPDNDMFVLGDGEYVGQEVTIASDSAAVTTVSATKVKVEHARHADGGGIVNNEELTVQTSAFTDGSPLVKLIWDGSAWMSVIYSAVADTHGGIVGLTTSD